MAYREVNVKQVTRHLGEVTRRARLQAGLTQEETAELVDLAPEVYGRLERGHMMPSVHTLLRLCRGLGVDASTLLGQTGGVSATPEAPAMRAGQVSLRRRRALRHLERLDSGQLAVLGSVARLMAPGHTAPPRKPGASRGPSR